MAPFVIAQSSTGGTNGAWGAAALASFIGIVPFFLVTVIGFTRYMTGKTPAVEAGKALFIGAGAGLATCLPIGFAGQLFSHLGFSFGVGALIMLMMLGAVFFFAGKFLSEPPRTWSAAALVAGGATAAMMLVAIIASAFGLATSTPSDGSAAYGYLLFAAAIGAWIFFFPPCLLGTALGIMHFRKKNGPGPSQLGPHAPPPPAIPRPRPQPPQWG